MIWYDMIWYDMIDMIWYDMIWYDMIWYDMIWFCNLLDFSTFHLRKSLKRLRYFPAIRDYCWHESVPYLLIVPLIECLFSPHSLTLVLCQASSGADRDAMRHSFLMPAWLKSWLGACAATIQVVLPILMRTAVTPIPVEASYPIGRRV